MPQVLKDEVEARIRAAALTAFAQHGYEGAAVAEIARRAGISPGNIYRYFPGKEALFAAVVPATLVDRFRTVLQEWLAGTDRPGLTAAGAGYVEAARPLVELTLSHRLEVVILLGQATGTPYSAFPEEVAQLLVGAALSQPDGVVPGTELPPPLRFALEEIQRSYVWALVRILETFSDPEDSRQALIGYERFHHVGLRDFLAHARG